MVNTMRYGLRIETGTERATIVDIFNIIQKVRDTGIRLKVDEEQWKIAQESKRQASGYDPRVCDVWATAPRYSSCSKKNTVHAFRPENQKRREVSGDQRMASMCCASNRSIHKLLKSPP